MGKPSPNMTDLATVYHSTVSAVGRSGNAFLPKSSQFALRVRGSGFSGSWRVVTSDDGGQTWDAMTLYGDPLIFYGNAREIIDDPEPGIIYDIEMLSGSGSLLVRYSW